MCVCIQHRVQVVVISSLGDMIRFGFETMRTLEEAEYIENRTANYRLKKKRQ